MRAPGVALDRSGNRAHREHAADGDVVEFRFNV